jgi:capsular polysaccharide biosynthesis protein
VSEQTLDVRGSLQIVRRHIIAVLAVAVLGLIAGASYAVVRPPLQQSEAQVVLPPNSSGVATQAFIASSDSVLRAALRSVDSTMSLQTVRNRVAVRALTSSVLSIEAEAKTAGQAEALANAVARSYVTYAGTGVGGATRIQPKILNPASTATGTSLVARLLVDGIAGLVIGGLLGALGALIFGRGDRRLRERDDIASAIGLPVLASLDVWRPTDPRDWTKLLDNYKPTAIHTWRLGNALRVLGLASPDVGSAASSVAVLTLASDRRALALGPLLAICAAESGLRTTLVIGPTQDTKATAALQAACAARGSKPCRSDRLRVALAEHASQHQGATLTVVVVVVNDNPLEAKIPMTDATVLGVTAGATTADQLARAAAGATVDGRRIDGILLADPDPADHTTGRVPEMARPRHRAQPTRVAGVPVRSRRSLTEAGSQ